MVSPKAKRRNVVSRGVYVPPLKPDFHLEGGIDRNPVSTAGGGR
jgi:hypothetical protein